MHFDDPQAAPRSLVLLSCWLRALNPDRAFLQGLRPVRTAVQRQSQIIDVVCQVLGVGLAGIAPKLRQSPFRIPVRIRVYVGFSIICNP
jgi:hypothetical protein